MVSQLKEEVELAQKREAQVRHSMAATEQKVAFLMRKMESMQQKEQRTQSAAKERILQFTKQVAGLKEKLAAADRLAVQNDRKIDSLSVQVGALEKREEAARTAAVAAGEISGDFLNFPPLLGLISWFGHKNSNSVTERIISLWF